MTEHSSKYGCILAGVGDYKDEDFDFSIIYGATASIVRLHDRSFICDADIDGSQFRIFKTVITIERDGCWTITPSKQIVKTPKNLYEYEINENPFSFAQNGVLMRWQARESNKYAL